MANPLFDSWARAAALVRCRADSPGAGLSAAPSADCIEHRRDNACVDTLVKPAESSILTAHRMLMGQ